MARRPPRTLGPCVLLLAFLAQSCVTASVWGGGVEEDEDGDSRVVWSGGTPLSDSVVIKILATPIALAFDLCLSPVQAWLYGWNDDDDEDDC